jgi:hypothetical protein
MLLPYARRPARLSGTISGSNNQPECCHQHIPKNHRSRKVTFGSHDKLKTIEGYSAKDVDRVIESALKLRDEWTRQSLEQREQWKLGSSEPADKP